MLVNEFRAENRIAGKTFELVYMVWILFDFRFKNVASFRLVIKLSWFTLKTATPLPI